MCGTHCVTDQERTDGDRPRNYSRVIIVIQVPYDPRGGGQGTGDGNGTLVLELDERGKPKQQQSAAPSRGRVGRSQGPSEAPLVVVADMPCCDGLASELSVSVYEFASRGAPDLSGLGGVRLKNATSLIRHLALQHHACWYLETGVFTVTARLHRVGWIFQTHLHHGVRPRVNDVPLLAMVAAGMLFRRADQSQLRHPNAAYQRVLRDVTERLVNQDVRGLRHALRWLVASRLPFTEALQHIGFKSMYDGLCPAPEENPARDPVVAGDPTTHNDGVAKRTENQSTKRSLDVRSEGSRQEQKTSQTKTGSSKPQEEEEEEDDDRERSADKKSRR